MCMTHGAHEPLALLACRVCAKMHRIKALARDGAGRPAADFLFTCRGCGKTELRQATDIHFWPANELVSYFHRKASGA